MQMDGGSRLGEQEVLKAVFPLLAGQDLGACMCVCSQWRELARDDYLWKQLCAQRWPSILSSGSSLTGCSGTKQKEGPMIAKVRGTAPGPYFGLFSKFGCKPRTPRMLLPKLRFEDLEFYVDIWSDLEPLYSTVVQGPLVLPRISNPPAGVSCMLQDHLRNDDYKLTVSVSPLISVKLSEDVKVSILVRRRDDMRVACICDISRFDYHDGHENLAYAFEFLQISPLNPFVFPIRAWIALLLLDSVCGKQQVFGIELDFVDAARSDNEVLRLLEILDWKFIA